MEWWSGHSWAWFKDLRGAIRVETDQAFVEIFGRRPDWLAALDGRKRPSLTTASKAEPKVFKSVVECDLVVEPVDPVEPGEVWEFQLYYDRGIFVRTESARLAQWRRLNSRRRLRSRDYEPRGVNGTVVFGERSLCPPGSEDFPHLRIVFLDERLDELETEDPEAPVLLLLRPLVSASDPAVESRAAGDYHQLCEHQRLEPEERRCFSTLFMQFLMQRFRNRTPEQIRAMIKELVPVEETRAGRELIAKGRQEGWREGIEEGEAMATRRFVHRLREQGLPSKEIADLTGIPLEAVEEILSL